MDKEALVHLISEQRRCHSEMAGVEAKAAHSGTPPDLFKPLSALANRVGGGVILFGLDEDADFKVVGVYNPRKLQEDISGMAAQMVPQLRPCFTFEEIDGGVVVAVEVPEIPNDQKPCYHGPHHLQGGAFIRSGNSTRRMSDYEIFSYYSSRSQPLFDEEPVSRSKLTDLSQDMLEGYLARMRQARPRAPYWGQSFEQILKQLRIACDIGGVLHPTLAGLLMFGAYPQAIETQISIVFLQYYGTTTTEKAPSGARFLDNRKFEGPIPEMIDSAVSHIMTRMRTSSVIDGLYRKDIPEYPEIALREAVVNAVAHRDYSNYVRGSHIQIRLFADRLEIESPGGLYGNVTLDNLVRGQSTRNLLLMHFMEDMHLVENRGSGIDSILESMREKMLPLPVFEDGRTSFQVTFYQVKPPQQQLSDEMLRILAYIKSHGSINRSECQSLLEVTGTHAGYLLTRMKKSGQLRQEGRQRGARYLLP